MDAAQLTTIICAVLASPLVVKLVEAISAKIGKKSSQLDRIEKSLDVIIKDVENSKIEECRTNLMLLLHAFRDSTEIPVLGKIYIKKYDGDSYIIPLLVDWYDEKELAYPDWLKDAYDRHCIHKLDEEQGDN